jgi:epoxyqueuosine reductase
MNGTSKEITELLKGFDVDVFGLADLSLYDKGFVGLDESITERYRFAVSFGLVLAKGILDTVRGGPNLLYLHHYRQLNYRLDIAAYGLAREIERRGHRALPFGASQLVDWRNQKAHISHKKIGQIAGVGWIGRNNLLIHPVFGAQVRYNSVLTDMPLVPDRPLERDCGGCTACITRCPVQAIKEKPSMFDHLGCFDMLTRFKNERNLGHHICGVCIEACKGER